MKKFILKSIAASLLCLIFAFTAEAQFSAGDAVCYESRGETTAAGTNQTIWRSALYISSEPVSWGTKHNVKFTDRKGSKGWCWNGGGSSLVSLSADNASSNNCPNSPGSLKDIMISNHNRIRSEVGDGTTRGNLSWDSGLASDSQSWAETIAGRGSLDHAQNISAAENLASSYSFGYEGWENEKTAWTGKQANGGCTGANYDNSCGHYENMVKSTYTKVGCGIARGSSGPYYYVCRYK